MQHIDSTDLHNSKIINLSVKGGHDYKIQVILLCIVQKLGKKQ
jgi:hypothetical protein